MTKKQMFTLSSTDLRMPHYAAADGTLVTRMAHEIPLFQWPDGTWCHDANRYMRELYEQGLSRTNRGGTLATVAAHITHLLRFCWRNKLSLADLTDDQFTDFIASLTRIASSVESGAASRSSTTVLSIGRSCLSLLASASKHRGDAQAVGVGGRIRLIPSRQGRSARYRERDVPRLTHAALPLPSPKKRRLPITAGAITRLSEAAVENASTPHLRMRRLVLLRLLEFTGGRRGEIAAVTVSSIFEAARMAEPSLRMITLKTRALSAPERELPISHADLSLLLTYVDVYRRPIVRKHLGTKDHGVLLVSERTGEPLRPHTLTNEVRALARGVGSASPHLFRHRFITKLFVALIEQHEFSNPDQFRRLLLDGESLKRKVAEWTGHRNLASLDHYIHLAFDEAWSQPSPHCDHSGDVRRYGQSVADG